MLAEVGYFEADNIQYSRPGQPLLNTTVETDALPVTFGLKFERPLSGNLSAYVGGNLGAAFLDMTATRNATGNSISENSAVFTASVFAGLVYNVSPSFEIFGGARWIYFDDTDIGGWKVDLGDDVLLEGGLRFNF